MNPDRARRLQDSLAARHAFRPAAPVVRPELAHAPGLVAFRQPQQLFGLAGEIHLACLGADPPAVERVSFEPEELGGAWTAEVRCTERTGRWCVLALRLEPTEEGRKRLWDRLVSQPRFCCRVHVAGLTGEEGFGLDVEAHLAPIRLRPPRLDFGALDPVGAVWLDAPSGRPIRVERAGDPPIEVMVPEGAGGAWLALPDGAYRVERTAGAAEDLLLARHRRELVVENLGALAVRLVVEHCSVGLSAFPRRLRLPAGARGRLCVWVDPQELGPGKQSVAQLRLGKEIERTVGDRVISSAGEPEVVLVEAAVAAEIPALVLAREPVRVRGRVADGRWLAVTVPCRRFGAGSLQVGLVLTDAAAGELDRPLFRWADHQPVAGSDGAQHAALELEADLAALLADRRRQFVLHLDSDQPALNLRRQEVLIEVAVEGRLLATEQLAVELVAGLAYSLPLAWRVLGADGVPDVVKLVDVGGLPRSLKGALRPAGCSERLVPAVERAHRTGRESLEGSLEQSTALVLDLSSVRTEMDQEHRLHLVLEDPTSGLRAAVELDLYVRPPTAFFDELTLESKGRRASLDLRLTNPLSIPFTVVEIRLEGRHMGRFQPLAWSSGKRLCPGEYGRVRTAFPLPGRTPFTWLRKLFGRGPRLVIRVLTDLPGEFEIVREVTV